MRLRLWHLLAPETVRRLPLPHRIRAVSDGIYAEWHPPIYNRYSVREAFQSVARELIVYALAILPALILTIAAQQHLGIFGDPRLNGHVEIIEVNPLYAALFALASSLAPAISIALHFLALGIAAFTFIVFACHCPATSRLILWFLIAGALLDALADTYASLALLHYLATPIP